MSKTNLTPKLNTLDQAIIEKIETFHQQARPIIIGIDGTAGSGKTSLANMLDERYDAQIFHMDDFFLPKDMRTEERLNEPGGNVHYERFLSDVLEPLKQGKQIDYRPYDCQVWDYSESTVISPKKINIIEGVYSLHPNLQSFYDWKLFLTVDPMVQKERIQSREGEGKLDMFFNRWIPLEQKYFEAFNIEANADLVIDTSNK